MAYGTRSCRSIGGSLYRLRYGRLRGRHITFADSVLICSLWGRYDILSLSDCDAAMYPANAWALQGPSGQLVSVPLNGKPLAAHSGCASGLPITASHYGSGFVRGIYQHPPLLRLNRRIR